MRSDTGAVLVHTALILIGLMALSAFVVDRGVLWAARRQAQNAADSGALAGAVTMFYDTNMSPTGVVLSTANKIAASNPVWAEAPQVQSTFDCPSYAPWTGTPDCVRVDVYRDQDHGNPLPMYFGLLMGRPTQSIRATATARVQYGNATDCLKPWGVVDKWAEHYPVEGAPYIQGSIYDRYLTSGPNKGQLDTSIPNPDVYIAPTAASVGTGFHPFNPDRSLSEDYGRQLWLTVGTKADFQFGSGWFAALRFGDSSGGKDYGSTIKGCVGVTYQIGDEFELDTGMETGAMVGPTRQAVETDADSLLNKDPTARWDPSANGGRGGVVDSAYRTSPRIVAVPLIDPDQVAQLNNDARRTLRISNIMGFFVEGYDTPSKSVIGRLMTIPGLKTVGASPIGGESAFMHTISLIR
jgi:hypothetical protein